MELLNHPSYYGTCIRVATTPCGRFALYKHEALGVRGPANLTRWAVHDKSPDDGKKSWYNAQTKKYANCFVALRRDGLKCAPWFPDHAKCPPITWVVELDVVDIPTSGTIVIVDLEKRDE